VREEGRRRKWRQREMEEKWEGEGFIYREKRKREMKLERG
jgi:hypothetical protein